MKTLAAIKNELFQDYIKLVSTNDLESTLDNPNVPVPFVCVASVENAQADALVEQLNQYFSSKKLKNKDFLCVDENDLSQLHFMFNLIKISSGGQVTSPAPIYTPKVEAVQSVEVKVESTSKEDSKKTIEKVEAPETVVEPIAVEKPKSKSSSSAASALAEALIQSATSTVSETDEESPFDTEVETGAETTVSNDQDMIESLGIPKYSVIKFIKNEEVTASIVDEKTVMYEDEQISIIDAAKKAFKKSGATGMALGLANWSYEGVSLKALKDKNS